MIHYRLRSEGARHQPSFRVGETYLYLRDDTVAGYVILELMGKPRCVPERDFERVADPPTGGLDGS